MIRKILSLFFFSGVVAAFVSCNNGVQEMSMTGICDGYPASQTSNYVAPWSIGTARTIGQGNCGPASHQGNQKYAVDIGMPIGSNIVAARAGTVYKVVQDKSDGNGCAGGDNHIYITHSDGTTAHYVHLTNNGSKVNAGDVVTQGQLIGLSGNTGCSSGPHLHFEVDSGQDSGISIPVTFNNVGVNERGLIINQSYTPH